MKNQLTGTYEYTRDSDRLPICWDYPNNRCLPHFHSSLEIIYVRGGEVRATLDGRSQTIGPGEIILVPSYVVHHFATDISSDTLLLIVPLDYLPGLKATFQKKSFSRNFIKDPQESSEFLSCLEILASEKYPPEHPVFRGYVQVIVGLALEYGLLIEDSHDPTGELGRDILTFLQDNFREDLALDQLAAHFGYSKSRFSHIFNERFQTTLSAYLNSLRCRHAASLLLTGVPQLDAAMQSGFDNIRTFYRAFSQYFQETPKSYCDRMLSIEKAQPINKLRFSNDI
ncbi:MAG: AraC family transcriptional regulator [Eubacteriales bacterium]|nr:AraC family transcriptional regulator [Eubacteriales bacterium]